MSLIVDEAAHAGPRQVSQRLLYPSSRVGEEG